MRLTVHARTVAQLYRLPVHYDRIRQAVETMTCPVIANGHVYSAAQAQELLTRTGARGLMIGRGVIRSPWLFNQIRQQLRGEAVTQPTGRDVCELHPRAVGLAAVPRQAREGAVRADEEVPRTTWVRACREPFLHQIRRSQTADEFHRICREFLDHDQPMAMLPAELVS